MKLLRLVGDWLPRVVLFITLMASPALAHAQSDDEIRIKEIHGVVELSTDRGAKWERAQTNQLLATGHRVRTGPNSRATLIASPGAVFPFKELTEVEILPATGPSSGPGLHIFRGLLSIFYRDKPERIRTVAPAGVAGVKGTEFIIAVDAQERTTLYVVDGEVQFTNAFGSLSMTSGEYAVLEANAVPVRTAAIPKANLVSWANNLLQWAFYYPAVLDPRDLAWTADETQALRDSLAAYQAGDLPGALAAYDARQPATESERIYYAALLLAVGKSDESSSILAQLDAANASERGGRLATALRLQIATVKREPTSLPKEPELTTELLAASYFEQARAGGDETLQRALNLAKRAASNSPQFGFAWVRVAELEFSFGRTGQSLDALEKGLAFSPRNAQALALKGFLLAAQNKPRPAIEWFDRAIATDPSLANAWLGRGLCRIRRGDVKEGREDLLIAAALEPRRAQLRSYLGKAFGDSGDKKRAIHELNLAKELDPADPTPWLYSALIKAEHNQLNEAIDDLEKSQELNDNRSVYRSSLQLDQDRAVRNANLARIYEEAGLTDVAVREAARAVNYDYANYSAHLFLAGSYNALRDPNLINLRYEAPAQAEYLLANLLAPVGAGILSPAVSQQEYSKLFERDRLGVVSATEYLSWGAWTESGAQYGTFGNFSYSLEAFYHSDNGQGANQDIEQRQISLQIKQQLTAHDTVFFQITDYEAGGGDLTQRLDPAGASRHFRFDEEQEPNVSLGYHREWGPGVHTLFLAARVDDTYSSKNPAQPALLVFRPDGTLASVQGLSFHEKYRGELELYSTELQQIWQQPAHNTIVGARFQYGDFNNDNYQDRPSAHAAQFPDPPEPAADQDLATLFRRLTFYGYHQWQIVPWLQAVGGLSYDYITYPKNFRTAPLSDQEETVDRLSPKAGLIWTPARDTTVRFAYTRSLAGASLDQSFQLEPSQVAGFVQSYRSIIPESVAGANAGAQFETFGLSVEQKFSTRTYLGLAGEILNSKVHRQTGAFLSDSARFDYAIPTGLREHLDYEEEALIFTLNQLVGEEWSFGARYRLSRAELRDDFVDVPSGLLFENFTPRQDLESILGQLSLSAIYNHRCGFFAAVGGLWLHQHETGSQDLPDEDVWQVNAFAGYRFPRRKAEISVGVLNLTDQDYRISPLNVFNELPRERTLAVRFRLNF